MGKGRLEAFSDGVLAIVITIMVLELKVPHSPSLAALAETYPVFLSYVLSFVYIGIYWNNHHHLFGAIRRVTGGLMWANLHLLFWLSLVPFSTAWMGENGFARTPSVIYGMNLFAAALAFSLVGIKARALEGPDSTLARSFGGQMTAETTAHHCRRTPLRPMSRAASPVAARRMSSWPTARRSSTASASTGPSSTSARTRHHARRLPRQPSAAASSLKSLPSKIRSRPISTRSRSL